MFRNKRNIFYREKFDGADEYDLFLRLLSEGKKITNLEDFLIKYRINRNSISFRKRFEQAFFSEKIKDFYWQRKKFGKDKYEIFNPSSLSKPEKLADYDEIIHNTKILAGFQDNQMFKVRKEIRFSFKRYGFNVRFFCYYILSFFPKSFVKFMRRLL